MNNNLFGIDLNGEKNDLKSENDNLSDDIIEKDNIKHLNLNGSNIDEEISDIENLEEDENLINNYHLDQLHHNVIKQIDNMNLNNKNYEPNTNFRKIIKERINNSNDNNDKSIFNLDNKP